MNRKTLAVWLAVGVCATALTPSFGQHGGRDRGQTKHRKGFRITTSVGDIVTDFEDYRFVVPQGREQGSFYVREDKHFYAPPSPENALQPAVPVEFGAFAHTEELVQRLEYLASQLCLDMHHNYRQNPGFRETYREAYQLWQESKHVHEAVHQRDRQALGQESLGFDKLFHHIQEDTLRWRKSGHRAIGQLSLHAKLEEMEAVIHHLLFDLGVEPEHGDHHDEVAPQPSDEIPPPPE